MVLLELEMPRKRTEVDNGVAHSYPNPNIRTQSTREHSKYRDNNHGLQKSKSTGAIGSNEQPTEEKEEKKSPFAKLFGRSKDGKKPKEAKVSNVFYVCECV